MKPSPHRGGEPPIASPIPLPADWPDRYAAWLDDVRPLLESADWGAAFAGYPYPVLTDVPPPISPLRKPLADARVAIVGSGGLTAGALEPFDAAHVEGDPSFRVLATNGPLESWRIDHGHYDTAAAQRDYNSIFPLDSLSALAREGAIGEAGPRHVSFMGYLTDVQRFLSGTAPSIAAVLQEQAVDAALLVPV